MASEKGRFGDAVAKRRCISIHLENGEGHLGCPLVRNRCNRTLETGQQMLGRNGSIDSVASAASAASSL